MPIFSVLCSFAWRLVYCYFYANEMFRKLSLLSVRVNLAWIHYIVCRSAECQDVWQMILPRYCRYCHRDGRKHHLRRYQSDINHCNKTPTNVPWFLLLSRLIYHFSYFFHSYSGKGTSSGYEACLKYILLVFSVKQIQRGIIDPVIDKLSKLSKS